VIQTLKKMALFSGAPARDDRLEKSACGAIERRIRAQCPLPANKKFLRD